MTKIAISPDCNYVALLAQLDAVRALADRLERSLFDCVTGFKIISQADQVMIAQAGDALAAFWQSTNPTATGDWGE